MVLKNHRQQQTATYLVESLQQAQDAALDLLLVQASASAVHPQAHEALDADGSSDGARSSHQSRSSDGGGSGSGADGRGGCAEDSSAEHGGRLSSEDRRERRKKEERRKSQKVN